MFGGRQRKIDKVNFVIAGAQKSGTTALHHMLERKRQVCLGDQQEIHFFDIDENFVSVPPDYATYHDHYPRIGPETIVGDCTPSYLYHPPVAQRMFEYNPEMRIVALLRNPVERAFAQWNMERFKGREKLDFLDAVEQEDVRRAAAPTLEARRYALVDRGRYATQLERYLRVFPREQLKIVKFDHFRDRQRETVDAIFAFLGLDPLRKVSSKDRNVVPYERAMTPSERAFVYDKVADEIARLEQLLGWDCSDWKP